MGRQGYPTEFRDWGLRWPDEASRPRRLGGIIGCPAIPAIGFWLPPRERMAARFSRWTRSSLPIPTRWFAGERPLQRPEVGRARDIWVTRPFLGE